MDKGEKPQKMHNYDGENASSPTKPITRSLLSGEHRGTTEINAKLEENEVSIVDVNENIQKIEAVRELEDLDTSSDRDTDQDEDSVSEDGEEEEEEEDDEDDDDEEDFGADDEASEIGSRKPQIQRETFEMSPEDVAEMIEGIEEDIIEFIGTYGKFDQVIEQYKAKVKGLSSRELEDPVRSKEAKKRKWLKIFKYQNIRNERKERLREILNARNNTNCSPAT